jgi:hypothetical protein
MTDLEFGWVVGFLEGDGCFYARKRSDRTSVVSVNFSAVQVQRWPLERLEALLGGHIRGPYPGRGYNRRLVYSWALVGTKAVALGRLLLPHLSPEKRERMELALTLWDSVPHVGRGNWRRAA